MVECRAGTRLFDEYLRLRRLVCAAVGSWCSALQDFASGRGSMRYVTTHHESGVFTQGVLNFRGFVPFRPFLLSPYRGWLVLVSTWYYHPRFARHIDP
jgi:hypothetical protein